MNEVFAKARRHLSRRDVRLKRLIAAVGPCTLQPKGDYFGQLVRAIIAQQISTKAAKAIHGRLCAQLGKTTRPRAIVSATDAELRGVGLSAAKVLALRDLAQKCLYGQVRLKQLADLDDEAVIDQLIPVRGIGRWTAEMFLIFSLGRLDVLPVGDFGLRAGIRREHGLAELPNRATVEELTATWAPYRSIGTWYIWRSFDIAAASTKAATT